MDLENTNILITGGAGFIGSSIAEYLLLNNVRFVRILDNLSTGFMHNIEPLLKKYKNIEFMFGDITDMQICEKACQNISAICHQAALGSVPRSIDNPFDSHNVNVNGFFNILISAKKFGINRIVYASSSSVYGSNDAQIKIENKNKIPLSPYAVTKCVNELYANVFNITYNMECIGLRYFNVFGPKQNPDGAYAAVIPKFIKLISKNISPIINGDGNYSRDFTYIDNVVYANVLALTTNNANSYGQVFNVGTNNSISINKLFYSINNIIGSDCKIIYGPTRKGDVPYSNASIDKAHKILGYQPIVYFEEGLLKTVNFFMQNSANK